MSTIQRRGQRALAIVGVLLLAFGLGCLNYTEANSLERHRESASRLGLIPPSESIFQLGVVAVVAGSGSIGYSMGARNQASG